MKHYNNSLFLALKSLHPEYSWDPLKFSRVPTKFWEAEEHVEHFHKVFKQWQQEYNIKELRQWYQLPRAKFLLFQRANRGNFCSVNTMFKTWFPETNWSTTVQSSESEVTLQVVLVLDFVLIV